MIARLWFVVLASLMLSACATSSPQNRLHTVVPDSVSAVYSEIGMRLYLVTEANTTPCIEMECEFDRAFDQRVLRLGAHLAQSAFEIYPDLAKRFGRFEFVIAEKSDTGSTSSAAGTVVIFRGVQKLHLDEEALAFVIAREMGHIIARHHDEDAATNILFTVAAQVLMPFASIIGNISNSTTLLQTASATSTVTATAAASAASFVGSRVVIASYKSGQLHEADVVAMDLLASMGWNRGEVSDALTASAQVIGDDKWSKDLRISAREVVGLAEN